MPHTRSTDYRLPAFHNTSLYVARNRYICASFVITPFYCLDDDRIAAF